MPVAALRDRRGNSGARTRSSADRARPRVARPAAAAPSKLHAARTIGIKPWAAAAFAALLALLVMVAALATGGRGERLAEAGRSIVSAAGAMIDDAREALDSRALWVAAPIGEVHLQGASRASQQEILRAAAVRPGDSLLSIDLNAVRARVEQVGWVDHATVIRLWPGTVVIAVTERPLLAVWQHAGRRDVITANGRVVGAVDASHFPRLPRIIGDGANLQAAAILPVLAQHPRLMQRVTAIRRVDTRRWDLLLRDGGAVLLPASDEAAALVRLDRLDKSGHVLDLDVARIDLRRSEFTVVRPRVGVAAAASSHGV